MLLLWYIKQYDAKYCALNIGVIGNTFYSSTFQIFNFSVDGVNGGDARVLLRSLNENDSWGKDIYELLENSFLLFFSYSFY